MNAPASKATRLVRRDYEGIVIDILDDVMLAETRAKELVDRLDGISQRPSFKVIDIDMYLWIVAAVAIASVFIGFFTGYFFRALSG
jgi:hypothetical protein